MILVTIALKMGHVSGRLTQNTNWTQVVYFIMEREVIVGVVGI